MGGAPAPTRDGKGVRRMVIMTGPGDRPAHHQAQRCLREHFAQLDRRFDAGFDPADSVPADPDEMRPPAGADHWFEKRLDQAVHARMT